MSFLDFFFDDLYYVKSSEQGAILFDDYKQQIASGLCPPPNAYFAEEKNLHLLYEQVDDKKHCKLSSWLKDEFSQADVRTLDNYLYSSKESKEKIKEVIADYSRKDPFKLECLLGDFLMLGPFVTKGLASAPKAHVMSEETIVYYEKVLKSSRIYQGSQKAILSILINYAANHAEDESHAVYLSEVIGDKKYADMQGKLSAEFLRAIKDGTYFAQKVFENLKVLPFKAQALESMSSFIAYGIINGQYEGSYDSISLLQKLLPQAEKLSLDAMSIALGSLIDRQQINSSLIKETTEYALSYKYSLPLSLIDKVFNLCIRYANEKGAQDQLLYIESIAAILENHPELSVVFLNKIVDSLLSLVKETRDSAVIKKSIFIIGRMFQQHVELPSNILSYFEGFLNHQDVTIQKLALGLFKNLSVKFKADADLIFKVEGDIYGKLYSSEILGNTLGLNKVQKERLQKLKANIKLEIEAQDLINLSIFQTKLEDLKHQHPSVFTDGVCDKLHHLRKNDWLVSSIVDILGNISDANIEVFVDALQLIYDYGMSAKLIDREGRTLIDVFKDKSSKWIQNIQKLFSDNQFSGIKDVTTLLEQFDSINQKNPEALSLKGYLKLQLQKLHDFDSKLFHKVFLSYDKEPLVIEPKALYVYNIKGSVFYKVWTERGVITKKFDPKRCPRINNILLNQQPIGIEDIQDIYKATGYYDRWSDQDFINWRSSLKEISDDNIAEVLSALKQALYQAKGFFLRDAQIISILTLFKSQTGRLAEISTGEGKSEIIAVFAALKVLSGHHVDILTSSPDLAQRDASLDGQKPFYDKIGITVDHNTDSNKGGVKTCYAASIVYGTLLSFIGDTLEDISSYTKLGRGFDILIVDEVDNMFIDQNLMKVQKSNIIPGFESLKLPLVKMWGYSLRLSSYLSNNLKFDNDTGKNYLAVPKGNDTVEYEFVEMHESPTEFLKNRTVDYIESLLGYNKVWHEREVSIPSYLREFVKSHLGHWGDALLTGYFYDEKIQYIVLKVGNQEVIVPVDKNTGVLLSSLRWSDGLHQFLQLKHSIALQSETLISIFMSYVSFFHKYKGSIYGVTGTLGKEHHHDFLREVYEVDFASIPQFVHKKLTVFPKVIVNNKEDWVESISDIAISKASKDKRAVLIIAPTIGDVELLFGDLKSKGYSGGRVFKYGDGSDQEAVKGEKRAGDIIVATNLAGRGTDIKITKEVEVNGGLHTIFAVTSDFPDSRTEAQAFGRPARKGERGSAQLVINISGLESSCDYRDDICISAERDAKEKIDLKKAQNCNIPDILLRDEVFDEYVRSIVRKIDSPTGYDIVLSYKSLPQALQEQELYLYLRGGAQVFMAALFKGKKITLDITNNLKAIDNKIFNHLVSLLSKPDNRNTLNKQDFELLHFLGANRGLSNSINAMSRVAMQYELLWSEKQDLESLRLYELIRSVNGEKTESEKEEFSSQERLYLIKTIDISTIKGDGQNKVITNQDLNNAKLRELHALWLADRDLYNKKYEIMQAREKFAIWLRGQELAIGGNDDCDIINKPSAEAQKAKKDLLFKKFAAFRQSIFTSLKDNTLMVNPAYLVRKAYTYHDIHLNQSRSVEGILPSENNWYQGIIEQTKSEVSLRGKYSFLSDEPKSDCDPGDSLAGSLACKAWALWDYYAHGKVSLKQAHLEDPLGQAVSFLETATGLDKVYSWVAHNALCHMILIKDGSKINHVDQAQRAHEIKERFISESLIARQSIVDTLLPQEEAKLGSLVLWNITSLDSALALQSFVIIKIFKLITKQIEQNIETANSMNEKQMIRAGRLITVENLGNKVNITDADIASFATSIGLNQSLNFNQKLNTSSLQSFNIQNHREVLRDFLDSGVLLFEVSLYDLEEDEEDWFGTIFSGLLGVIQIFAGVALSAVGGPFASVLGSALIMQGMGDIIGSISSVFMGIPINMDSYFKSKGIALAISLATASLAHLAVSLEMFASGGKILEGFQSKIISPTDLAVLFSRQVGLTAIAFGFNKASEHFIEHNDGEIRRNIDEEVENLISRHREALILIFASDAFDNRESLKYEIYSEATKIMNKYSRRFNSDGARFVQGVASGFGNIINPALGAFSDIAGTATTKVSKAAEATGHFTERFGDRIEAISEKAKRSGEMMSVYLRESYPGEEVGIMEVLRGGGFASGREINYRSCSDISKMDLGRFASKQAGIVGSCEQVARLMRSQEAKIAAFSNNLRNSLSKQVNCIISGEIMPVFTNFAAQKIMETDVMQELTEDVGYIVTTGAPKLKEAITPQKSEAQLEEEFNKLPKPEKEIVEKYRAEQVKKAEEIKAQQAAENKEQVVGSPKAVSTKTEFQRKAAQTIRDLSAEYNKFAEMYPLLAEYGLSALNVALKTAIGGPVGLAKAVSEEVIGEVSGRVAAKYIEKAVDSAAYQIQANNPDLSEEDARTLASASALGLVMFTFGPKIAKEMLSDLKHLIKMKKLSPPPKIEIDVDGNAKPIDHLEQKPPITPRAEVLDSEIQTLQHAEMLKLQLASEAQMAEKGIVIAGIGSNKPYRGAAEAAKKYGGVEKEYVKKTSSSSKISDTTKIQTHWVENIRTGARYELKTKIIQIEEN